MKFDSSLPSTIYYSNLKMNVMKPKSNHLKRFSAFFFALLVLASCSSTTLIQSTPSGAKLYINDEAVGKTPYSYSDTKIIGSVIHLRMEKEGYEPLYTSFSRNEEVDPGAIIGGLLCTVPFLWTMRYKSQHMYELTPIAKDEETSHDK